MTLVYVFAWWHLPLALAVLVLGLWWAFSQDDGGAWNFAPALIGCGTFIATAGLLVGALCTWLAGR